MISLAYDSTKHAFKNARAVVSEVQRDLERDRARNKSSCFDNRA